MRVEFLLGTPGHLTAARVVLGHEGGGQVRGFVARILILVVFIVFFFVVVSIVTVIVAVVVAFLVPVVVGVVFVAVFVVRVVVAFFFVVIIIAIIIVAIVIVRAVVIAVVIVRPIGIVVAALLFGTLAHGGFAVNALVPRELVEVLQAVIILTLVATSAAIRRRPDEAKLPADAIRPAGGPNG